MTRPRIIQLANENVLERDKASKYEVAGNVLNYINNLKKQGESATSGPEGQVDYWQEKAQHEKVKRELAEIELAKKLGQIHGAEDVKLVMSEMLINLRTKFQGFPTQLSQSLVGKNQEQVYEILTIAVEKLLAEMSEYNPKLFNTEIEDEEYVSPD